MSASRSSWSCSIPPQRPTARNKSRCGELIKALDQQQMQTLLLWPNIDAGADHISKSVRVFRDQNAPKWLRTITNLTPGELFKGTLAHWLR